MGGSLLHGAYSGKINGAKEFFEVDVVERGKIDNKTGEPKLKKVGTTKDIAVGTVVGMGREVAEGRLNNTRIARAYLAEEAIERAAKEQGKDFRPNPDAVTEMKRVADSVSPEALRP